MSEQHEEYALTPIREAGLMPAVSIQAAVDRFNQLGHFVQQIMKPEIDYGVIPGTNDKPTLKKPGAEKLKTFFGMTNTFEILRSIEDWDKPLFYYLVRCHLYRAGVEVGQGDGSCNSRESKYRYREAKRSCPACHQSAIIKGKEEYGAGWVCHRKAGGCGAKFKDGDPVIERQQVGRIENPDIADQVNTIIKQAEKRSLVAAVLITVNASEFFTQDLEDWVETEYRDVTPTTPGPGADEAVEQPGKNGKAPAKPEELLAYVNARVAVKYENASVKGAVAHLFNAIRAELGPTWNWPKDQAGWQRAADAAIKHAQAKAPDKRAEVIAHIDALVAEYEAVGQPIAFDPAWLREAPLEDIIQQGSAARARLDAIKAKQAGMPGMEGPQ